MNSIFNKIISAWVMISFTFISLLSSIEAVAGTSRWFAPAALEKSITRWENFALYNHSTKSNSFTSLSSIRNEINHSNWVSSPNIFNTSSDVIWPKDNFSRIATAQWLQDPETPEKEALRFKMAGAEKWIRFNREEIGQAGIRNDQMSSRIRPFPHTGAYVFANYSVESGELIVEIQKVEKDPWGNIGVFRADYTPWHGEKIKWRGDYRNSYEKDTLQYGYNPFDAFKGKDSAGNDVITDNVFHNISWEAVGVVVGAAMKEYGATAGWIASDKTRFTQRKKKSGSALRKKVTVYIDGYAKPQWFVAMPLGLQPRGGVSSICVGDEATGRINVLYKTETVDGKQVQKPYCNDPAHVAMSGVSIQAWEGGNMPVDEEKVYAYKKSKSGFTVLAFTIFTFALTWGVMAGFNAIAAGSGAVGAGSAGTISATTGGLAGAGVYAGVNALNGNGLTTAQASFAGSAGDGVLDIDTSKMDEHQRGLRRGVQNLQINSRMGVGLNGVEKFYHGNCPETKSYQECKSAGLEAGTMFRTDNYAETNIPLILLERKKQCEATYGPIKNSYTEEEYRITIQQCTAPKDALMEAGW